MLWGRRGLAGCPQRVPYILSLVWAEDKGEVPSDGAFRR